MPQPAPKPGDIVLDAFRLLHPLGAGSFAVAYLAEQLGTDRRAVVKIPHAYLLNGRHGAEIRRRFEVEARAASRVTHPNVVTIYTLGRTPQGIPVIAMEFAEGEPLSALLAANAPLALVQVAALGEQLGAALLALHEVGIVHRDLAPSNVMVHSGRQGLVAKLLDFGVAKLLDAPNQTVGPMGTPGYLAPEQLQGSVTPRADVYSLGAILWWALTGQERPDDFADGRLLASLGSPAGPDPLAIRPDAPAGLAAVVSRMLIPDHRRRLTVEGFLAEWREALDQMAVPQLSARSASSRSYSTHRVSGQTRPRVAVVVSNSVLRTLTTSYLETRSEFELDACSPRELTRSNPGTYAAAVIDADLAEVDPRELLGMLSECHENMALVVIGSAEQASTRWTDHGAASFVQLPEELTRLRGDVARALGRRASTQGARTTRLSGPVVERLAAQGQLHDSLTRFMGAMPCWIGDIQVALSAGDYAAASSVCQSLLATTSALGLRDLDRLGRAAAAFFAAEDHDSAIAFADALERGYHEVFPEIFALIQSNESRPEPI